MNDIQPIQNAVHVCSLNTSWIKKIANQAVEEAENGDKITAYRLMWLNVAMAFNRQYQMQYILSTLGSKGKSPKFRAVRMHPFWHKWKREILRGDWATLRENVDLRVITNDLRDSSRYFESQRIELAARAFQNSDYLKHLPLRSILTPRATDNIYAFTTPGSNRPGYYNQGYNYVESTALSTMSDVSDSETETQELDPWDRPLEDQFKDKAVERQFKNIEFTRDPKAKREENPAETQETESEKTAKSRDAPGIDNPPEKQENPGANPATEDAVAEKDTVPEEENVKETKVEEAKKNEVEDTLPKSENSVVAKSNNTTKFVLLGAVVALLLIIVGIFVFKGHASGIDNSVTKNAPNKK